MPTGTLSNLSQSGFVRTPPAWAERIARNLLSLGRHAAIFDPTCGEGDLLAPFAAVPGVDLYGVEISRDRADVARQRLPQATLVVSAIEAVRFTPASMDMLLANPPYFFEDGRRAEYRIIADAGMALRPGGILVAILPARSAWDATMINHWCKHYEQIRCWKFPDGDPDHDEGAFQKYTQIVVVGVRRATPLKAPETLEQQRLSGWRWRQLARSAESPWAQGTPPPDLPEQPIDDPYLVPEDGIVTPELIPLNADEATLLAALAQSGVQRSADWMSATTWQPEQQAEQPVMPPTGEAHLAALILTGLFDGEALTGPDGDPYAFVTCISQEAHQVALDPEDLEREHQKGVASVSVQQLDDHPVLGCLNLRTGEAAYYQGEDVFTFLTPWLNILASRVLAKHQPLYRLNPAQWELDAAHIGLDKHLPGAAHPGLVAPQLHRVFGTGVGLDMRGRCGIQGEPGTGKTRMSIAVMARQAALWQRAERGEHQEGPVPAWVRQLRLAWKATPRARALLGPTRDWPAALPVLVAAPRRNTTMWREETLAAWPEAEAMLIESYLDMDRWMRRCAESRKRAVVGIVAHSQSRAFGREWRPAVIERRIPHRVPDLEPADALKADLEAIIDQGRLVGYRVRASGEVLTKQVYTSSFHCPDCGALVEARPWGKQDDAETEEEPAEADEDGRPSETEDDELEPVTERVWFERKPRWCRVCHGALWTETRTTAAAQRAKPVPFATWAAGAEQTTAQRSPASAWGAALVLRPKGKLPAQREDGKERTRPASGIAGMMLGKADRTPRARIPATSCRVLDAAGTRGPAAPESFSPYEYLQRFYPGCVGLSIVDESHNARGRATDIAHSIHQAQLAAQTCVYASGTHYGGTIDDLFYYWYRYNPRFWRRFGLGWNDVTQAIARFGVIQQWRREREEDARRGSGRSDVTVTTVSAPGISARLLPFLLGDLVFLSVLDVGAHMPPRVETPEIVSMADPQLAAVVQPAQVEAREAEEALKAAQRQVNLLRAQLSPPPAEELEAALEDRTAATERRDEAKEALLEAQRWAGLRDLLGKHQDIVGQLRDLAQRGSSAAALAQGTIPRWWSVLPCVTPAFRVEQRRRGKWGELLSKETLLTAPILTANHVYPLEQRAQEIVQARLEAGKVTMLYYEQVRHITRR